MLTLGIKSIGEEYDCTKCGACCSFKWSWPVLRKDRADAVKIPIEMQRQDYPLLKTSDAGRCVALRGEVGQCVSCSIYADRPDACRKFVPGSTLCKEARAKFGISAGSAA
jgi:Fe-S-cluster containining protein